MNREECYIGIDECGCVLKAMVKGDYDDFEKEYEQIFEGIGEVELVSTEEARERFGWCEVHKIKKDASGDKSK